jgi:hypothetical protein
MHSVFFTVTTGKRKEEEATTYQGCTFKFVHSLYNGCFISLFSDAIIHETRFTMYGKLASLLAHQLRLPTRGLLGWIALVIMIFISI